MSAAQEPQVTEADRERAREITCRFPMRIDPVEAIAHAIAAERAKALAPFLALADTLESVARDPEVRRLLAPNAYRSSAAHIRRAAGQQP